MSSNADMPYFKTYAPAVCANGYLPIPVRRGTKVTRLARWQLLCGRRLEPSELQGFIDRYPNDSVALLRQDHRDRYRRPDETRAAFLQEIAVATLGPTPLIRFGRRPKRMLIYRSADPYPRTQRLGDVEIIGSRAYLIAFGIHPLTGRPYEWVGASPLTLRFDQVSAVGSDQIQARSGKFGLTLRATRERKGRRSPQWRCPRRGSCRSKATPGLKIGAGSLSMGVMHTSPI